MKGEQITIFTASLNSFKEKKRFTNFNKLINAISKYNSKSPTCI